MLKKYWTISSKCCDSTFIHGPGGFGLVSTSICTQKRHGNSENGQTLQSQNHVAWPNDDDDDIMIWEQCTVIWNRQLHIPYLYVNINTADHESTATKIREASISCIHSCLSFKMTWVGIVYNCEVHTKALSSVRPFYQTQHALHYTCDHARLMSCTHPVVSCSTLHGISLAWDEASFQEGFEKRCMTTSVAPCCTYFCYPSISKVRSLSKTMTASELIVFPWRAQSHQEPPESAHWHTMWVCNSQYPRYAWRISFTSHQHQ